MTSAIEVTAAAHGGTVVLAPGQVLSVRLDENPSTGYRWAVESCEGLQLDADSFQSGGAGIGAAGQRWLTLRATRPGRHRLSLLQRREWDPSARALAQFELTVTSLP